MVPVVTVTANCLVTQILSPWDRQLAEAAASDAAKASPAHPAANNVTPAAAPAAAAAAVAPAAAAAPAPADHAFARLRQRRRLRRERRERRARRWSFFSFVSFLFIVPAMAVTLATAINVPDAMSVGLPHPDVARTLHGEIFPGYPQWPQLLVSIGTFFAVVLTLFAAAASAMARRRTGILHILRGIVAVATLVSSAAMLGVAFGRNGWLAVAERVHNGYAAAAVA